MTANDKIIPAVSFTTARVGEVGRTGQPNSLRRWTTSKQSSWQHVGAIREVEKRHCLRSHYSKEWRDMINLRKGGHVNRI